MDLKDQTFQVHDKVLRLSPRGIEAAERFKASTGYEVDFDGMLDHVRRAPPGKLPAGFGMAFEEVDAEPTHAPHCSGATWDYGGSFDCPGNGGCEPGPEEKEP
jgi:hypothetical protein